MYSYSYQFDNGNAVYWPSDIAIVFLEESSEKVVYKTEKIWPACLPSEPMNLTTGDMSLASGWGTTYPYDRYGGKGH